MWLSVPHPGPQDYNENAMRVVRAATEKHERDEPDAEPPKAKTPADQTTPPKVDEASNAYTVLARWRWREANPRRGG